VSSHLDTTGQAGQSTRVTSEPAATSSTSSLGRTLLPRYEAYQRHQVREFLALLPREGLRVLYRKARAGWAREASTLDPVARLSEFVRELLPLPPFHVWFQDLRQNLAAHLDEPWMSDVVPHRAHPFVLETRTDLLEGASWRTELRVYRTDDGVGWLGYLSFTRASDARSLRTVDVFREADAQSLLARFREFDRDSLEAFLRSVAP
jgi:hypothetical protein